MKLWNNYSIPPGEWARWQIGPLSLFVQRGNHEWVFAWETGSDLLSAAASVEVPTAAVPSEEVCEFARYVAGDTSAQFSLMPRLGDRPFIVRPASPLIVLAGQEVILYLSTVVWISARVEDSGGSSEFSTLLERPVARPSDTWFGVNTREGELCYASRTNAHTDLGAINRRPHRAVIPVEIRNEGTDTLAVDQLRVPVPVLSLHEDADGMLWTDTVRLEREEGERSAALTVSERSLHLPEGYKLLAPPREPVESGTIVEAFSRFLG